MEFFDFTNRAQAFLIFSNDDVFRILWMSLLIGGLCFALVYVFESCALYTIAKREGYANRWMAFVPFVNTYYVGVLSDKNRVFNLKSKTVSLIAAIVEAVYAILSLLSLISLFALATNGYLQMEYTTLMMGEEAMELPMGFIITENTPQSLFWAEWMAANIQKIFLSWIEIIHLVLTLMLLIAFFQTYSSQHYVLFSICCIIFPVKGILFFAVRNNKGKNYRQYLKELHERQYRAYQEYTRRQNGANPYNYNPYSGKTQPPPAGDPYGETSKPNQPSSSDPFDEFSGGSTPGTGTQSGGTDSSSDDPFDL